MTIKKIRTRIDTVEQYHRNTLRRLASKYNYNPFSTFKPLAYAIELYDQGFDYGQIDNLLYKKSKQL